MHLSDLLRGHRSIRQYRPDPIAPDLIEEVCEEAILGASSSGNLNSISIVLTQDPERKEKLFEFHFEQPMILQAPLVVTFCGDWHRTRKWLAQRGARDNFNNLLGYHVAAFDAMIIAQNVSLGFQARGLGICYMGTTLSSMAKIAEFLELPDTCVPVTSIVVGYPDENPSKRDRLPFRAMIHEEKYKPLTEEDINELYRQREVKGWERYMSMPEVKKRIEELGIESLAQYYTSKIKYDPDEFLVDSAQIKALLEEKHFLP